MPRKEENQKKETKKGSEIRLFLSKTVATGRMGRKKAKKPQSWPVRIKKSRTKLKQKNNKGDKGAQIVLVCEISNGKNSSNPLVVGE